MKEHPITPPPELVKQWSISRTEDEFVIENWTHIATQAARWGADQQLAEDAKWLDHNALNEAHLKTIPVGDLLKEAMRPKPPSLQDQALDDLERIAALLMKNNLPCDTGNIRRALESLPS